MANQKYYSVECCSAADARIFFGYRNRRHRSFCIRCIAIDIIACIAISICTDLTSVVRLEFGHCGWNAGRSHYTIRTHIIHQHTNILLLLLLFIIKLLKHRIIKFNTELRRENVEISKFGCRSCSHNIVTGRWTC